MNNQDPDIFEIYRPFRNKLTNFNLIESLYLIWGYSRNYTFNYEFPRDIEKPNGFNPNEPNLINRKHRGLYDHELEFFQKEFIINCDIAPTKNKLKDIKHFTKIVNHLRDPLENAMSNKFVTQDNILIEFNRLAHRQFKWQSSYDRETIFRYYQIYSDPILSSIIKDKFKLTTNELFLIGFFFFTYTGKYFRIDLPIKSQIKALPSEMFEVFMKHFSITIDEARRELKEFQQINKNLYYTYNPLLAKPILIEKSSAICPIPLFIYWQFTSGIYYQSLGKGITNFTQIKTNKSGHFVYLEDPNLVIDNIRKLLE